MKPTIVSSSAGKQTTPGGWSPKAVAFFAVVLTGLAAVGVAIWWHRPPAPAGLPADPEIAAALAPLAGGLPVASDDLRFASSIGDPEGEPGVPPDSAGAARVAEVARRLAALEERHRRDPRYHCLLGHLDLSAALLERAERRYRAALSLASRYGEARLGLGLALAKRATLDGDKASVRALSLQAIAQFAAVEESDPLYLPALYDRAVLLAKVGRSGEARELAERYAALEPGSPWTAALRRSVGAAR